MPAPAPLYIGVRPLLPHGRYAFGEVVAGRPAGALGPGGVDDHRRHLPGLGRAVTEGQFGTGDLANLIEDIEHRERCAGPDHHRSRPAVVDQSEPDGGDHVGGVDVVADLGPVAVDLKRSAGADHPHQACDDAVLGLHAQSVDVGQAQARAPQPVGRRVGGHQHLGGGLGGAVGRERLEPRPLSDRGLLHRAGDGIGRSEGERGRPGSTRRLEQTVGALHVRPVGELGLFERAQHGGDCGEVDDRVESTRKDGLENLGLGDVADYDVDSWIGVGLEVDHADPGAVGRQGSHDVAADEAGPAGDEHASPAERSRVDGAQDITSSSCIRALNLS